MITSSEFQRRLIELNINVTKVTIIKYIKNHGGKLIANKWYCTEDVFEKFINGENNEA